MTVSLQQSPTLGSGQENLFLIAKKKIISLGLQDVPEGEAEKAGSIGLGQVVVSSVQVKDCSPWSLYQTLILGNWKVTY